MHASRPHGRVLTGTRPSRCARGSRAPSSRRGPWLRASLEGLCPLEQLCRGLCRRGGARHEGGADALVLEVELGEALVVPERLGEEESRLLLDVVVAQVQPYQRPVRAQRLCQVRGAGRAEAIVAEVEVLEGLGAPEQLADARGARL